MAAATWDIYCRVIDNLGDAGVCWRLAADLAGRGRAVRLVIDDPAPLRIIAPGGTPGVSVHTWPGPDGEAADVIIEAFGCDPPPERIATMQARRPAPVWINLEYLSAESYVERCHGLPSPQRNGLMKWFFYPGFTARTGGLIREPGLTASRRAFDRHAWLAGLGLQLQPGERVVSLFCYENPRLPDLLDDLARLPTLLLATPGQAQEQLARQAARPGLRIHALPWLDQPGYDHLLWSCDLNFVRGEDSLVRALWAGAPLVWQIYPQHDGAHAAKLQALLDWMQASPAQAAVWAAWNGLCPGPWPGLAEAAAWADQARNWGVRLQQRADLVTELLGFVESRAERAC
jgi:uncharacterized repeat protein (TIGR03837 family)